MSIEIDLVDLSRAVGRPVATYDVEAIDPHLRIHSVTGGVYRVHGDGFSLVVKVIRNAADPDPQALWSGDADPAGRNYWKREWLAFDSGLLDALPGSLRAPRRLLTTEPGDDECWIWMEEVTGRPAVDWSINDFAVAARHVGQTQGKFAATPTQLPTAAWLSRRWLRGWVDACAPLVDALRDDDLSDDRLAALRPLRQRVLDLWQEREELLNVVESAPHTLVHCDLWGNNLFAESDATVAVDWSQVGIGAVAQDLDQMTLDTVWMPVRPDESLEVLEAAIVPAYARGLHVGGFDVDESQVRRWYAAAASAHYPWMAGMVVVRAHQPDQVAGHEKRWGRDYTSIVMTRARVIEQALRLGEWALESSA